jgi:hypothetical protein
VLALTDVVTGVCSLVVFWYITKAWFDNEWIGSACLTSIGNPDNRARIPHVCREAVPRNWWKELFWKALAGTDSPLCVCRAQQRSAAQTGNGSMNPPTGTHRSFVPFFAFSDPFMVEPCFADPLFKAGEHPRESISSLPYLPIFSRLCPFSRIRGLSRKVWSNYLQTGSGLTSYVSRTRIGFSMKPCRVLAC